MEQEASKQPKEVWAPTFKAQMKTTKGRQRQKLPLSRRALPTQAQ
jgi:hypothetical protein